MRFAAFGLVTLAACMVLGAGILCLFGNVAAPFGLPQQHATAGQLVQILAIITQHRSPLAELSTKIQSART